MASTLLINSVDELQRKNWRRIMKYYALLFIMLLMASCGQVKVDSENTAFDDTTSIYMFTNCEVCLDDCDNSSSTSDELGSCIENDCAYCTVGSITSDDVNLDIERERVTQGQSKLR